MNMKERVALSKEVEPEEVEKCQERLDELKDEFGEDCYSIAVMFD